MDAPLLRGMRVPAELLRSLYHDAAAAAAASLSLPLLVMFMAGGSGRSAGTGTALLCGLLCALLRREVGVGQGLRDAALRSVLDHLDGLK